MMRTKIFWLQVVLIIGALPMVVFSDNRPVFFAEDYGNAGEGVNDSTKAIQAAIDAAIEAGPGSVVQLKKGKYRISAEDLQPCLKIESANDLVIQGQGKGTELIVTNPRCSAIHLIKSKNVFVKSLIVDYDPLPYTQGRVVNVNAKEGYFDLDIDEGFLELDHPCFAAATVRFGLIFEGKEPEMKTDVPDHIFMESWQKLSGRIYRLQSEADQSFKVEYIAKGDRFVQLARTGGGCFYFGHCDGGGLIDVEINASISGAAISFASDGLVFKRLEVKRRPNTTRLLSTNSDAIHCQQNRVGPLIEDCLFEYIADDTINIYSPVSRVIKVIKPDELILSEHCIIKSGDRLQVYDPQEGRILAECRVKALEELPNRQYRVQLDQEVPEIRSGSDNYKSDTAIFNLSASGEGYVIRNNRMTGQRRYGILVRGGKGLIEGNYIDRVHGWGIVLANDPGWPEGPLPYDVVIRNNTIIRSSDSWDYGYREDSGSIVVVNMRTGWKLGKGRAIRNIVIEGNKIIDPVASGIFVGGAENVTILNNEIIASKGTPLYEKRGAVRIANCNGVKIEGLKVDDPRPNCIAAVEILADTATEANSVIITNLQSQLHEGGVRILDNRELSTSPKK